MNAIVYLHATAPPAMILQRRYGRSLPGAAFPPSPDLRFGRLRGICLAATDDGTLSPRTATAAYRPVRIPGVPLSP